MIERTRGNLLEADVDALVNTVNTVGVMGKGIALQFKKAFPENFKAYEKACAAGEVEPGRMLVYSLGEVCRPRFIINFPTKRHWRGKSSIDDIRSGLAALVEDVKRLEIRSIALPPLGCGQGGLVWDEVLPLIEQAFADLPDVHVLVYEPAGAPAPGAMKNRTARPRMTIGRAAVLGLMSRYLAPGYDDDDLSLLEVQKLAYFLQEAGEFLKLRFQAGFYGPYADNLRHVLNHMEGHYIQGFGDGLNQPETVLVLLPGAAEEAEQLLNEHPDTKDRFARVVRLIDGFETPYGMELLATVHWVARSNPMAREDVETVITAVKRWNTRKSQLFQPQHITTAWKRLLEQGWFETKPQ